MNKETRKFIWGFFWMLIGALIVVDYLEPAFYNESLFTTDMLFFIIGAVVMINGYMEAKSTIPD